MIPVAGCVNSLTGVLAETVKSSSAPFWAIAM
jgi:hypothetical protein